MLRANTFRPGLGFHGCSLILPSISLSDSIKSCIASRNKGLGSGFWLFRPLKFQPTVFRSYFHQPRLTNKGKDKDGTAKVRWKNKKCNLQGQRCVCAMYKVHL